MMKIFAREEVMIPVKCNVHPWMRAYIGVVSTSVLRRDGRRWNVYNKRTASGDLHHRSWHEKYGPMEQTVTVGPKESKTVDFSYKG